LQRGIFSNLTCREVSQSVSCRMLAKMGVSGGTHDPMTDGFLVSKF
jgi:hypothetical protein